jgi:hypothetical protein
MYHLPQFRWSHFRAYLHRPVENTREPIRNNSQHTSINYHISSGQKVNQIYYQ